MTEDLLILGELIAEQAAHMDAAEHRLLANIREFDHLEGWASAASCAHWLSWRVGWTLGTAREHVRVAKALGSLPHIDDALRTGKVSYCKVRAMTRVATPANEQVLLMDAQLTTGSQLERVCRKYRQLQRNEQRTNPSDDDCERFLRRRDLDNGMVSIEAVCHPEEAALIWAAIEQATKELLAARQAEERAGTIASSVEAAEVSAETCAGNRGRVAPEEGGDVSAETCAGAVTGDAECDGVTRGSVENEQENAEPEAADEYEDDCAFFEKFGVCPEPRREPAPRVRAGTESVTPFVAGKPSVKAPAATSACTKSGKRVAKQSMKGQRWVASSTKSGKPAVRWAFNRLDGLLALMRKVSMGESLKAPVEVVVTVTAEALANRASPQEQIAFLDDDGCIGAETARRLSCDAGIVCMVEDEHGNPMSAGRRTRSVPTSIGRALVKRDTCCRFPGCTNNVFLDAHHLKHWALGGATALDNLVRLCARHHRFVHEYGYRVEMDDAGQPVFFDPQGRPAKDVPDRILRDDLGWEHILSANGGLAIEPHVCGWDGEPIRYDEVCHALYRVDADELKPGDIC